MVVAVGFVVGVVVVVVVWCGACFVDPKLGRLGTHQCCSATSRQQIERPLSHDFVQVVKKRNQKELDPHNQKKGPVEKSRNQIKKAKPNLKS
ncbi:MAG: hypothetical protein SGPRY_008936 [Prymnesium sp.]